MKWLPLALSLALTACGDPPETDPDTGPGGDAAMQDAGPPAPLPTCYAGERTVQPVSEPSAIAPADEWLFAFITGDDPHFDGFLSGTMQRPAAGTDAQGVLWEAFPLLEPNVIGRVRSGSMYAVGSLDVPEGQHVLARAGRMFAVGTENGISPGDVYGASWSRVPIVVNDGETNDIFVRVTPSRSDAELELFATPDEVYFNLADRTAPHLRVGDDSEQWLGVMILNLTGHPLAEVSARVVASEHWEATEVMHRSLPAGAVTQVAFRLTPTGAWATAEELIPVTLEIESECLELAYEATTELETVAADATFQRTFRSDIDDSVQYYGVRPPSDFDPTREYALVLSLHGAGVGARGQVDAYAAKDWAYIVAPTNRRPFGFDWEAWGRLDGIEVLEHAMGSYDIDPTRVYVTGHSMGGHGAWQFGVHFSGRFALVGPSAGWSSFYSYGGSARPTGPFARSSASSDTDVYATNLARRAVYIIHGDADDNVPVTEARNMRALLEPITMDLGYHEQPGAGHWWDDSPDVPGTDCVDWAPMFMRMQAVRLDPTELEFDWRTPSPFVNARHSYVTLVSMGSSDEDATVTSELDGIDGLAITTTNVRGMVLDGAALAARGITRATVDGAPVTLVGGPVEVGPQTGKRPDRYGPFNQAMASAWCWVYPDSGTSAYRYYAGFLASYWSIIGNGAACALPAGDVDAGLRAERNLIWLGVPSADVGVSGLPFSWTSDTIMAGGSLGDAGLAFVYPSGERLDGFIFATRGSERLLYSIIPFTSRFALPDYLVYTRDGAAAAGFFDAEWAYAP